MAADKTLIAEINGNVRHLIQLLQTRSKKIRKDTGITGPQLLAMKTLFESPDLSISELARRIYLHPATVVGIVDRLEDSEFCQTKALERRPQAGQRQADRERQRRPAKSPRGGTGLRAERVGNTPGQKAQAPLGQPLAARPDSRTLGERARRKTPQGPAPERRVPARQARRQKILMKRVSGRKREFPSRRHPAGTAGRLRDADCLRKKRIG